MMEHNHFELEEFLRTMGQEHLLSDFDKLSEEERLGFVKEIESVDFSVLNGQNFLITKIMTVLRRSRFFMRIARKKKRNRWNPSV